MMDPYSVLGLEPCAAEDEVHQAYRQLARRWHPDRFPEGPERMWAEKKMSEINEAHAAIISGEANGQFRAHTTATNESEQLRDVRRLLDDGLFADARRALMNIEKRSPEWNYLFGTVLFRLGEYNKSVVYFGVAVRQRQENAQYRAALARAKNMRDSQRIASLRKRIFGSKVIAR